MPQWVAVLLVAAVALVAQVVTSAFFYGRLTERVATIAGNVAALQLAERDKESRLLEVEMRMKISKPNGQALGGHHGHD